MIALAKVVDGLPLVPIEKGANKRNSTARTYNYAIKRFNKWNNGPVTLDAITDHLIDLQHQGKSASTAKTALKKQIIEAFPEFQTDIQARAKLNNAFKEIKIDKPESEPSGNKIVSPDEIMAMIEKSSDKVGLIIYTLYITACRVSELVNIRLKKCRVDGDDVTIKILGKRKKERTVVIDLDTFEKIQNVFGSKDYLFQSHHVWNKSGKISTQHIYQAIVAASKKIKRRITPHCLRHSWATHEAGRGIPLEAISKYLGHADVSITLKFYSHNKMTREALRESRERLKKVV